MARRSVARPWSIQDLGEAGDVGALAHYADPAYYDKTYRGRKDDVAYYVALGIASKGPVLEYGVGSGRVALPLARSGIRVTGVDLSRPMLRQLEAHLDEEATDVRRRVKLVHGDMRTQKIRGRFPLVIAPFNVVLHLYDRTDVEAFLSRVKAQLAPGGSLVFDFSMPQPADLCLDPNKRYKAPRFRHPTRGLCRYAERFEYDPLRQLLVVWMEFTPEDGSQPWMVPLTHRQFFPQEMRELLHYAGFTDVRFTQDFSDDPPTPLADSLVAHCRLARRRRRT